MMRTPSSVSILVPWLVVCACVLQLGSGVVTPNTRNKTRHNTNTTAAISNHTTVDSDISETKDQPKKRHGLNVEVTSRGHPNQHGGSQESGYFEPGKFGNQGLRSLYVLLGPQGSPQGVPHGYQQEHVHQGVTQSHLQSNNFQGHPQVHPEQVHSQQIHSQQVHPQQVQPQQVQSQKPPQFTVGSHLGVTYHQEQTQGRPQGLAHSSVKDEEEGGQSQNYIFIQPQGQAIQGYHEHHGGHSSAGEGGGGSEAYQSHTTNQQVDPGFRGVAGSSHVVESYSDHETRGHEESVQQQQQPQEDYLQHHTVLHQHPEHHHQTSLALHPGEHHGEHQSAFVPSSGAFVHPHAGIPGAPAAYDPSLAGLGGHGYSSPLTHTYVTPHYTTHLAPAAPSRAPGLKRLLVPLAGVALLGAAAALASNPVLLQLGVISGKKRRRRRRSMREHRQDAGYLGDINELGELNSLSVQQHHDLGELPLDFQDHHINHDTDHDLEDEEGDDEEDVEEEEGRQFVSLRLREIKLLQRFLAAQEAQGGGRRSHLPAEGTLSALLTCSGLLSAHSATCLQRLECEAHSPKPSLPELELQVIYIVLRELLSHDGIPPVLKMKLQAAAIAGGDGRKCGSIYRCPKQTWSRCSTPDHF